jgi:hypothetical protein
VFQVEEESGIVKAFRFSRGLKEERSALNESFDDEFEHEA